MTTHPLLPTFKISPNGPVFDLPIHIAREHGLFEEAGLEVEFVKRYDPTSSSKDPFLRQKEALFENRSADAYNLCEWAGLDRSERSRRGSRVLALRPAVAAQAIVSFDDGIREPRDLAGVPVGINELTGSHYTTLQMLEGAIRREDIVVRHAGPPRERYNQLRAGNQRAIAIMEPYISLALKEGAHLVAVGFYRGAEVISPDVPPVQRLAYLETVNRAADLIRRDFGRYKHYLLAEVKDRLSPDELHGHFVHYTHSKPLDEERFAGTYEWMRSWNLTAGENSYAALVAP